MSDKSVVITGASSGIGAACAEQFAKNNFHVLIGARREEKLTALRMKLLELGAKSVVAMPLDVRDDRSVKGFCDGVLKKFPSGIDVLINNAGLALGTDRLDQGSIEDWQTVIDTNVTGLLRVTRQLLPSMIAAKKGHVINMGSIASFLVYEGGSVYCASKHAVRAITKTLRLEVNGTGIRVTSIDPGMVETEFSNVRLKDDQKAKAVYQGLKPLSADDIADAVYWSASRPAHVNIDEIVLMPVAQAAPHKVHRVSP